MKLFVEPLGHMSVELSALYVSEKTECLNTDTKYPAVPINSLRISDTAANMQQPNNSDYIHVTETGYREAFIEAYTTWTHTARNVRAALKRFCSAEDLYDIKKNIQTQHNATNEHYQLIQRNCIITPDIVKQMDACITITTEICETVDKYLNIKKNEKNTLDICQI